MIKVGVIGMGGMGWFHVSKLCQMPNVQLVALADITPERLEAKNAVQINIAGDPYLWDDFAFATREGLVPELTHVTDPALIRKHEVDAPFYSIDFDFTLHPEQADLPKAEIQRDRAAA